MDNIIKKIITIEKDLMFMQTHIDATYVIMNNVVYIYFGLYDPTIKHDNPYHLLYDARQFKNANGEYLTHIDNEFMSKINNLQIYEMWNIIIAHLQVLNKQNDKLYKLFKKDDNTWHNDILKYYHFIGDYVNDILKLTDNHLLDFMDNPISENYNTLTELFKSNFDRWIMSDLLIDYYIKRIVNYQYDYLMVFAQPAAGIIHNILMELKSLYEPITLGISANIFGGTRQSNPNIDIEKYNAALITSYDLLNDKTNVNQSIVTKFKQYKNDPNIIKNLINDTLNPPKNMDTIQSDANTILRGHLISFLNTSIAALNQQIDINALPVLLKYKLKHIKVEDQFLLNWRKYIASMLFRHTMHNNYLIKMNFYKETITWLNTISVNVTHVMDRSNGNQMHTITTLDKQDDKYKLQIGESIYYFKNVNQSFG